MALLKAKVPKLSIFFYILRYLLHSENLYWLFSFSFGIFTGVFTNGASCLLASE